MSHSENRPKLPAGYVLGQQPKFGSLDLECVSHPGAEFSTFDNEEKIKLTSKKHLKTTVKLIQARTDKEFTEYVWSEVINKDIVFSLSFPEAGWYRFEIYALPSDDSNTTFPNVFNYLIEVKHAHKPVLPYPKQYGIWKEGCRLYTPLVLNPTTNLSKVHFKLLVPKAKAVAVIASDEWTHLKDNGKDEWEGMVNLEHHKSKNAKVTVNASYKKEDNTFSTLLEYKI